MKRLTLTQQTVRCPLHEDTASLTVRTDASGVPSRRYRDVVACSLQASTSSVAPERSAGFADMTPPVWYLAAVDSIPRHCTKIACSKACLHVLNAAESGTAEPIRCTSGVSDGIELVRQTQGPAMTRLLWFHSC